MKHKLLASLLVAMVAVLMCPVTPEAGRQFAFSGVPVAATVVNPIVGFAIDLPEDYEITTGFDGDTQMSMNGSYIASIYSPWYYFTYISQSPEEAARLLEAALKQPPLRSTTKRLAGSVPGEVVLTATIPVEQIGQLEGRWVFSTASHKNYVAASLVSTQVAAEYRDEIARTLRSVRVEKHLPFSLHQEPTEQAYKVRLPEGWKWEGSIRRGNLLPHAFDWKATAMNGAAGCFNAPPFQSLSALDAQTAATTVLPQHFQTLMAGFQFESFRPHDRASSQGSRTLAMLSGGGLQIGFTRGTAFYRATVNGVPIRFQVEIGVERVGQQYGGSAVVRTYGFWAPAKDFARLYPVARGVLGSLRTSRNWINVQTDYARKANEARQDAFERVLAMQQSIRSYSDREGNDFHVDMTNIEHNRIFKSRDGRVVYFDQLDAESLNSALAGGYSELTQK